MRKLALIAVLALASAAFASSASATKPPSHLVTICHATPPDTAANGYVQITVDIASSGYQHSGHADQHAADIIPAYSYSDGFSFPGKNFGTDGKAIYDNSCVVPEGVEPPVSPPVPVTVTVCRDDAVITLTIPPDELQEGDVLGNTCSEEEETTTTQPPAPPIVVTVPTPVLVQPNTTG